MQSQHSNVQSPKEKQATKPYSNQLNNPSTSTGIKHNQHKEKQVNCIQFDEPSVTLIPIILNSNIKLSALPDSGSVVTMVDKKLLPSDLQVHPWQKGSYKVAGSMITPVGWFTARLQVGKIDYIMPQIAISENLPVDMILGKDWQYSVYARIIHEPDGKICIITPTHTEYFDNLSQENTLTACCMKTISTSNQEILITQDDKEKVANLVDKYSEIFKSDKNDIGEFQDVELEIKLKHNVPIKCKPYRLPQPEREFLRKTIDEWIEQKICRHSDSPYAAPMFVVEQPFHSTTPFRPVVDYSKTINPITENNVQPIDRMEDIINVISQFVYKFKLDIYHAYHNIKIKEEDIYKTAVITQDHHVEFMRVMFGMVGGPSIMSKVINLTYGHLYDQGVRLYYDDISGGAHTIEQLLTILEQVFIATQTKKLKLNKEKCVFLATELPLFGRIIGHNEEKPDPQRTAAVNKYETLTSISEIRSFLGFTNTFRKYIQNYASIVKPLTDMLKRNANLSIDKKQELKKKQVTLTEAQQKAFQSVKTLITSSPILAYFRQDAEETIANKKIEEQHCRNKVRFDLRKLEHNFKEDEYVLYAWPQPQDHKLTPKYKGPYKIVKKIGSVCYEIQNVKQPTQKKIVHVQFLKPLTPPPPLDSFSAFSGTQNDDHINSDQYNNNDSDDANYHSDQIQEDHQTTDLTNTLDYDGTSHTGGRRQYVTNRGRITERPYKYDI